MMTMWVCRTALSVMEQLGWQMGAGHDRSKFMRGNPHRSQWSGS